MTHQEKYAVYNEMFKAIPELEKKVENHFKDRTIYGIFFSVADEENRKYFVDIEVGGSPETYRRIYGTYTLAQLAPIMR